MVPYYGPLFSLNDFWGSRVYKGYIGVSCISFKGPHSVTMELPLVAQGTDYNHIRGLQVQFQLVNKYQEPPTMLRSSHDHMGVRGVIGVRSGV